MCVRVFVVCMFLSSLTPVALSGVTKLGLFCFGSFLITEHRPEEVDLTAPVNGEIHTLNTLKAFLIKLCV